MRPSSSSKNLSVVILSVIMAVCASAMVLYATSSWGIAIKHDGPVYIQMAKSLATGAGVTTTHYPPLYPALLALSGPTEANILADGKWLNVILFGAAIFMMSIIVAQLTDNTIWVILLSTGSILFSADVQNAYVSTWSEGLYILLSLVGLFLLVRYCNNSNSLLLVASALSIAMAIMSRYLGLALVPTGLIAILFFSKRNLRSKILACCVFGGLSLLPFALWLLRNYLALGSTTDRSFFFAPLDLSSIEAGLAIVTHWLLPLRLGEALPTILQALLIGLIVVVCFLLYRRIATRQTDDKPASDLTLTTIRIFAIYVLISIALIAVTSMFFDRATTFNGRIMSPNLIPSVIVILGVIYVTLRSLKPDRRIQFLVVAFSVFYIGFYAARSIPQVISQHKYGDGLSSSGEINSPGVQAARLLPPDTVIYSNNAEGIYFAVGRNALSLPVKYNFVDLKPLPDYPEQLHVAIENLKQGNAVIIYFTPEDDAGVNIAVTPQELIQMGVPLVAIRLADSTIYRVQNVVTISLPLEPHSRLGN